MSDVAYPSTIPTSASATDGGPEAVGLLFKVTVDKTITGVRVKSPTAQSPIYVQLWECTSPTAGTKIAEKLGLSLAVGDNFIPFDTPVTVHAANTNGYVVCFGTDTPPSGGFHDIDWYHTLFDNPTVEGDFIFLEGRFVQTYGAFPAGSTSNYYGAGVYLPEDAPVVPVTVTTTTPVAGLTGALVTLAAVAHDGAGAKTWAWAQTSGPTVSLSGATTSAPSFTPPTAGTYVLGVTVIDDTGTASGTVTVTVTDAPPVPTATGETILWGKTPAGGWVRRLIHPEWEFHVDEFGAAGDGVTDDTAAIQAAIDAAYAYAVAHGHAAEIVFPPRVYALSSPTVKGGLTRGNAQLTLPVHPDTDMKVVLSFRGVGDGSVFNHWKQTVAQRSGTVLRSTLTGQTVDPTWGAPSILGGPTNYTQPVGGAERFTNLMVNASDMIAVAPYDPTISGFDFLQVAEANLTNVGALADAAVAGTPSLADLPTNSAFGVRMPDMQNNARSQVNAVTVEGFGTGLVVSDHFNAQSVNLVYCGIALFLNAGGIAHGISILSACIEACHTFIKSSGSEVPLHIGMLSGEHGGENGGYHVDDPDNVLIGDITVADMFADHLAVNGGANLRITDARQRRGSATPPAIPASGATFRNPFWRDAEVTVTGGTVSKVEVDGIDQGATSGRFTVPSGRSIRLTYTVAPSWSWRLW